MVHIQGGPKKVIPLVHILHCTRGITFFGPPGTVVSSFRRRHGQNLLRIAGGNIHL